MFSNLFISIFLLTLVEGGESLEKCLSIQNSTYCSAFKSTGVSSALFPNIQYFDNFIHQEQYKTLEVYAQNCSNANKLPQLPSLTLQVCYNVLAEYWRAFPCELQSEYNPSPQLCESVCLDWTNILNGAIDWCAVEPGTVKPSPLNQQEICNGLSQSPDCVSLVSSASSNTQFNLALLVAVFSVALVCLFQLMI